MTVDDSSYKMAKRLDWSDVENIAEYLVGHAVTKVSDDSLILDNGLLLRIVPNEGGCICGAGDYELTLLNDCPINAIMAVEVMVSRPDEWSDADSEHYDEDEGPMIYQLFVLAQDERIELARIEGDDGNGYYGTGFYIQVMEYQV